MFDVSASLIRYWEQEFDILKPKKNNKGNRLFTPEDLDNLKLIYNLVKERGFTLDGAKKKLKENPENSVDNHRIRETLLSLRELLVQIRGEL